MTDPFACLSVRCDLSIELLFKQREPSKIRWRPADFYEAVIDADLPEATRLTKTVDTWWPAILVALIHDVSKARTEGFNG